MALSEAEELELLQLKKRRSQGPTQAEVPSFTSEGVTTPSQTKSDSFDVGQIPESSAYGAGAGFFAPEILKGTGRMMQYSPIAPQVTRPLGVGMEVAGEALRGRRGASAVSGAVAGGAEESAIQLGKALGLPEPLQYGLGFVAGAGTPTVGGALLRNNPITSQFLRDAERGGFVEAGQRFAERIRGNLPGDLREPLERVVTRLSQEADAIRAGGQEQANRIMAEAQARAAQLAPGSESQAQSILDDARNRAGAALFAAKQRAESRALEIRQIENRARQATQRVEARVPEARQAIGQPTEMTDIGNTLRQKILSVQGDAIAKRKKDYDDGKILVAQEVAEKESRGDFVRDRPDFKAILEEAKQRGGIGAAVTETPEMVAATPQLRSFYRQLYGMLSGQGAQQEIAGQATGKLKLDFDQIDEIRRLLGDSFTKPVAEGYPSIQQTAERDLYMRLSKILGEYSPKKKDLISTYRDESQGLDIFKTARGKKATATDAYNDSTFVTDPSQLPKTYFTTRTGVEDLIELTGGDRNLVEQQARAFVARQLQQARTADQVRGFQDNYSELLGVFPNLGRAVNQFADQLGQTTRVTGRIGELQKSLGTELKALPKTIIQPAQKEAADIVKQAEAEAKKLRGPSATLDQEARAQAAQAQAQARREAAMLTPGMREDPVVFFDKLVEGGFTPQFEAAARVIKTDPKLVNDFVEGVKVSLSRVDPALLPDKYTRLIQPALLKSGLISEQQARQIANQVRLVGMTADPSVLPIRTASLIRNAIAANIGVGGSRLMESLGLSFTEPFLGGQ